MSLTEKSSEEKGEPEKSQDGSLVEDAQSFFYEAVDADSVGKYQQAFECYERVVANCDLAIEINPKNPDAYFWKGISIGNLGRLEAQQTGKLTGLKWDPAKSAEALQNFLKLVPSIYDPKKIELAQKLCSYPFLNTKPTK